uniref:Uncharacterized protein n=1 Tax=Odontella aurita TaxID=265563 RepID=A0A7S4JS77_9STRA
MTPVLTTVTRMGSPPPCAAPAPRAALPSSLEQFGHVCNQKRVHQRRPVNAPKHRLEWEKTPQIASAHHKSTTKVCKFLPVLVRRCSGFSFWSSLSNSSFEVRPDPASADGAHADDAVRHCAFLCLSALQSEVHLREKALLVRSTGRVDL